MKKLLLLALAGLFSVSAQSQLDLKYQWAAVLKSNKSTGTQGTNGMSSVVANADKDLFVLGQFGSFSSTTAGDFEYAVFNHYDKDATLTTKDTPQGAFPNNVNSANRDFLLYKMDRSGKIIWQLPVIEEILTIHIHQ